MVAEPSASSILFLAVGLLVAALQALSLLLVNGIRQDLRDVKDCIGRHETRLSRLEGEHNQLHGRRSGDAVDTPS